jgi:hypothetical protein
MEGVNTKAQAQGETIESALFSALYTFLFFTSTPFQNPHNRPLSL